MALDKQFHALAIDTGCLYSNRELYLHNKMHKIRKERRELKDQIIKLKSEIISIDNNFDFNNLHTPVDFDWLRPDNQHSKLSDLVQMLNQITRYYQHKNSKIKEIKENLSTLLANKVKQNELTNGRDHIRKLRKDMIYIHVGDGEEESNNSIDNIKHNMVISIFDSFLSRTLNFKQDELTMDYMVLQIYFFDIFKDVLKYGFEFNGERYIYYSSSAGQIRTKRAVFLKESLYLQHIDTIMCGLSIEKINSKGGCNANKYLAYLALANSATDVWEEFDIDKCIVIPDFENKVIGTYDFIDDGDYSITRQTGELPFTQTDGAGMVLPNAFGVAQKNKMVRLPWIKGLLGVFDYRKFIEVNHCFPVIKDIYGIEHDVIAEDIQVIFTESQFKMH